MQKEKFVFKAIFFQRAVKIFDIAACRLLGTFAEAER